MTKKTRILTFDVEKTDTYGGEANYSWVERYSIDVPEGISDLALVRRAKKLLGYTGIRCRVDNYGDSLVITPPRWSCTVGFVTLNLGSLLETPAEN
jgi:hypothetical protein